MTDGVLSLQPAPEQLCYTFGGGEPLACIRPGQLVEVGTEDCFGGRVRTADDRPSVVCQLPFVNPVTGPFWVKPRLAELSGLELLDTYQLVAQAGDAPVGNVCDPNYTFVAKLAKKYLPSSVTAYGGVHARLRQRAAHWATTGAAEVAVRCR
jgi:acetamidase/formamidase